MSFKTHSKSILSEIHKAASGRDIVIALQLGQTPPRSIGDASIYHKAMDKCKKMRDWQSIPEIMKLLLSQSHFRINTESLNHFIRSVIHSTAAPECIRYFEVMVCDHDITPNLETFTSIFACFDSPKSVGNIEKYWNLMRHQYHLEPPPSLYAQVMKQYTNLDHREKAIAIFHEYLERVHRGQISIDRHTFSVYLNIFSSCGDIEGMHSALDILKEHNIDCNHRVIITILAAGYDHGRIHRKCIDLIDDWIQSGNIPNSNLFQIECNALCGLLRDGKLSFSQKQKLYRRIERVIHCDLKHYGLDITPSIATKQLIAAILLYHNVNPMEMVKVYHELSDGHLLKEYISSEFASFSGSKEIDLHFVDVLEAQFVIRYLFGYRLNEVMDNGDDEVIWILVGKGKHSKGTGRDQGKTRQFVIKELASWTPPIDCRPHPLNHGLLSVDKRQCAPYCLKSRGMNAVKRMLLNPSTRWNIYDSRWMDSVERTIATSGSAEAIVSVMKSNVDIIEYPRFYVKAMKQCAALKDIGAVQHVMQLLMESDHDLTVEHFNVFFEIMVDLGVSEVNTDYLESMVRRFGITPDLKTYEVITGAVSGNAKGTPERREMNRILKEYFGDICETVNRKKKMKRDNVNDEGGNVNDEKEEESEYGWDNDNDEDDHLENLFECIRPRKGLNLHPVLVADVMRGYLKNGQYQQCIDIFEFCIREDIDRKVDDDMIRLKCIASAIQRGECVEPYPNQLNQFSGSSQD